MRLIFVKNEDLTPLVFLIFSGYPFSKKRRTILSILKAIGLGWLRHLAAITLETAAALSTTRPP
jgi:hypothetical protein